MSSSILQMMQECYSSVYRNVSSLIISNIYLNYMSKADFWMETNSCSSEVIALQLTKAFLFLSTVEWHHGGSLQLINLDNGTKNILLLKDKTVLNSHCGTVYIAFSGVQTAHIVLSCFLAICKWLLTLSGISSMSTWQFEFEVPALNK